MPDYILRGIPEDLYRQVKARAALEGISVREVLLRLMRTYVEKERTS